MNLCEPCTCSPPLLVMLIPEGDEEHDREDAQIRGRIARNNEWAGYDLYRFPFSQSRGHGRWRGFLLEKGGKELYSGGRGRGRGGFPCVRNLLDESGTAAMYIRSKLPQEKEKMPQENIPLVLLCFTTKKAAASPIKIGSTRVGHLMMTALDTPDNLTVHRADTNGEATASTVTIAEMLNGIKDRNNVPFLDR